MFFKRYGDIRGSVGLKDLALNTAFFSDSGFITLRNRSLVVVKGRSNLHKDALCRVPPSVYKKAKQAGDSRREGIMIMELEAILRKEGLTASASKDGMVLKLQWQSLKPLFFLPPFNHFLFSFQ